MSADADAAAELLAEIAAHPRSDDARRVYADLLTERGDPRGEFITLQLFAATAPLDERGQRRMRELERLHARAWLGPLAELVEKSRFERGFLAAATLGNTRTTREMWAKAVLPESRIELASLVELDLADNIPFDTLDSVLAALPHLSRLVVSTRHLLGFERHVAVLGVRVDGAQAARVALENIPGGRNAPEELRLLSPAGDDLGRVAATVLAFGRRLTPATHTLGFESTGVTILATRDADGVFSELTVTATKGAVRRLAVFTLPLLLDLAPYPITRLTIDAPLTPRDMRAIERACARFPDLALVFS